MVKTARVERRRFPRAARILCIHHRLHKRKGRLIKDSWHWHLSTTENMSANGLLFSSDVPYLKNDIIELKVVMSGVLEVFVGFAKVLRVEQKIPKAYYSTAVSLIAMPSKSRKANRSRKRF